MDTNVTDKSDQHSELNSLRQENRRLYELVERLIATQESEQKHRESIESGLDKLKETLEERTSVPVADRSEPEEQATGGDDTLRAEVERLGEGLERRLEEWMSQGLAVLERRLAALSDAQSEKNTTVPPDSTAIETTVQNAIAPFEQDLKRAVEQFQGLERHLIRMSESASQDDVSISMAENLNRMLVEIEGKSAASLVKALDQVESDRKAAGEALDVRLAELGRAVAELSTRQEDRQNETLSMVRDLVVSHSGRLTSEWAMQIGSLKRSVDDLRLELVAHLDRETEESDRGVPETKPNVVTGDFQRKTADTGQGRRGDESDVEVEDACRFTGGVPESAASEVDSQDARLEEVGSRQGLDEDEDDLEDALLTKPSEWDEESDSEEEPINLTGVDWSGYSEPGKQRQQVQGKDLQPDAGKRSVAAAAAQSGKHSADLGRIDLRAYKDLRLSCEPGDVDERQSGEPKIESAKPQDKRSYENAPAEASLTRFVRLIRARKRSTPS